MRSLPSARPLAAALLLGVGACGKVTEPAPIVGTFLATTLTMSPSGQGTINVLALGGTLGINIANNLVTAGALVLPPSVTGGAAFTSSLAGFADTTGTTVRFGQAPVRFPQPTDNFVRHLTFTLVDNRLEALNQTVAGTRYDVVLTRQ